MFDESQKSVWQQPDELAITNISFCYQHDFFSPLTRLFYRFNFTLHGTKCGAIAWVPIFLDFFAKTIAATANEKLAFVSLSGKFLRFQMG